MSQDVRLTVFFTLLVIFGAVLMWSSELGTGPLWRVEVPVQIVAEIALYVVVLALLGRKLGAAGVAIGAALTLIYRLAVGAGVGLLTAVLRSWPVGPAVEAGLVYYHPGVIVGVVAAPFAMLPVLFHMFGLVPRRPRTTVRLSTAPPVMAGLRRTEPVAPGTARMSAPTVEQPFASALDRTEYQFRKPAPERVHAERMHAEHPFEEAVVHLAAHPGARGAVVVDAEGLVVAHAGAFDGEAFAPIVVEMFADAGLWLSRLGSSQALQMKLTTEDGLIVAERVHELYLAAVVPAGSDDLVKIRFERARSLVADRLADRYRAPETR